MGIYEEKMDYFNKYLNKKHLRFLSFNYSLKEISNTDITYFIKLYNEALLECESLIKK